MNSDEELIEKRLALRQQLKSQLLTLSPSHDVFHSFNSFIPNIRDMEFVEKQGLDCVMNYLLINWNSVQSNEESCPNICSICRKDSTENWWENRQSMNIYCDVCEQIRRRNFILEQHRQSMKSAFLQAKENERRLEVNYQKKQTNERLIMR